MSCLSIRDEKQDERLNDTEIQLDMIESERLKKVSKNFWPW